MPDADHDRDEQLAGASRRDAHCRANAGKSFDFGSGVARNVAARSGGDPHRRRVSRTINFRQETVRSLSSREPTLPVRSADVQPCQVASQCSQCRYASACAKVIVEAKKSTSAQTETPSERAALLIAPVSPLAYQFVINLHKISAARGEPAAPCLT